MCNLLEGKKAPDLSTRASQWDVEFLNHNLQICSAKSGGNIFSPRVILETTLNESEFISSNSVL